MLSLLPLIIPIIYTIKKFIEQKNIEVQYEGIKGKILAAIMAESKHENLDIQQEDISMIYYTERRKKYIDIIINTNEINNEKIHFASQVEKLINIHSNKFSTRILFEKKSEFILN